MSSIYYALFILPLLFMIVVGFIFQSTVQDVEGNMFVGNCPFPLFQQNVTSSSISGDTVQFQTIQNTGATINNVEVFHCSYTTPPLTRAFGITDYIFDSSAVGYTFAGVSYASDVMSSIGLKIQTTISSAWLFINAPAQISALSFWTYINIFLFMLMGLGIFMAIRGSG